jgi:hypothetical protein
MRLIKYNVFGDTFQTKENRKETVSPFHLDLSVKTKQNIILKIPN